MVQKGDILTPDKKYLLIDELRQELSKLGNFSITQDTTTVKTIQSELKSLLEKLINKKGVVTPAETDEILDKIGEAKKARLGSEFSKSMKSAVVILGLFTAVGIGVYIYMKKRA